MLARFGFLTKIKIPKRLFSSAVTQSPKYKMQEGYVSLNSVPTHIMTWGNWIEDKFDVKTKEIVLVRFIKLFQKKCVLNYILFLGHDRQSRATRILYYFLFNTLQ